MTALSPSGITRGANRSASLSRRGRELMPESCHDSRRGPPSSRAPRDPANLSVGCAGPASATDRAAMQAPAAVAERVTAFARTPRARKILWWLLGLLAAFTVVGFLVVPPVLKSQLETRLSDLLHRKVTVETVRANPFAPSVTLRGFAVSERGGDAPFVTFDELYVNLGWRSIVQFAPVLNEVRLTKPHVRAVRNADRTYNFQDLVDEALARPKSEEPPPRFAVFNIQLLDGRVDIDDRAEGEKHEIADLKVGVPFISTLPTHVEIKVVPELSAKVNGAPLGVKGEALPFAPTPQTVVHVDLDDFDLTRLVDYLPFKLRAKVRAAFLDTRLAVAFEQPPDRNPQIKARGSAALGRVDVTDPEGRPMLALQRLAVEINEVDADPPRADLRSVELAGLDVHVRRDKSGAINLARIGEVAAAGTARQAEARKETGEVAVPIRIALLTIRAGKARFTDETTAPAFTTLVENLDAEVKGLDTAKGQRFDWLLSARTDVGETVRLTMAGTLDPRNAEGRLEIAGVPLKRYQPYVTSATALEIDEGMADLAASFEWGADLALEKHEVTIGNVAAAVKALRARLSGEKEPLVRVAAAEVKGAGLDLGARTITLGEVSVREPAATLRREKDGRLNVERIMRDREHDAAAAAKSQDAPWRIDLGRLTVERGAVALEDLAIAQPLKLQIAPIQASAEKLSTAKGQRGSVSLRATIDKTGTLAVNGPLTLEPLSGNLRVDAATIGIMPVQRYIDDRVNLAATSGAVSAKGTAGFALTPGGAIRASYKGDVSVTDFASIDKPTSQDLLKWKSLALGAIDFNLEPLKVSLDEVALADFYARIVLSAEGRLNLQDLARPPGAAPLAEQAAAKPEASPPAPVKPATPSVAAPPVAGAPAPAAALPENVRIGRITLQGGNVNFSDFFIKPNYTANLTGVGGAVTEMTREKPGDVELRARIDNAAPVEIQGRVNPLAADLFLDLKAAARDIELPPLSPYSVKYAGYGIERGKLSVKVAYHIENRKLKAENNIYLDQLTFGEKVDSPTATKLPVTLAVALLKDRNGVIDVNLPISGSLDDPQFSVFGIVLQVIGNLIVKAVTAPFALLGALVGGGEELAYLEFAPGTAKLDEADTAKLKNLTKALTDRPGLKLDVAGRVDPEVDREGLKRDSIDRKVKVQKFNDLRREGKAPPSADAVTVEKAEYERYLRRAYDEEKFPKPRNIIGFAKELPVPEMETLMLTHAQATEEDLRVLANTRAQVAKDWIVSEGKVPAERVFIVAPKLTPEGIKDKGKTTRVDFSLK
jgi:uncharacterized protein involved in outer membrane biogenesis